MCESCSQDSAYGLSQKLLADVTYKTDKQRIEAFAAHPDGGSRRTWFNVKKKLGLEAKARRSA